MEDYAVRETTLQEEIEGLEVPEHVRKRMLSKLKRMCEEMEAMESKLWEANHEREMRVAKYDRMREQIISLKSACFDLAAALKQQYEL